ncbi:MAG: type II toxin-antitoxin system VapC family toxin [Chloroflexi bacterium]|nr:type II toxin-antitoxin system VapC family toxin [Chloroflexota bacterium]
MTTVFIDTAVVMYAAGADHELREPCQRILTRVADGELDAVVSVEVVQEIFHRFMALRRLEQGASIAADTLDLFAPVLPVTHAVMRRMPELVEAHPTLAARDLVHLATCLQEGITDIVSPDRGFDMVPGIRRIDPANATET